MTTSDTGRKQRTTSQRTTSLRTGTEYDVGFNDLIANGQAVGRIDGAVVFCFGPLPGEQARVRITQVKQKYAVGELVRLLTISPHRAQPFCRVFGACGGCQLQHLSYAAQLSWKRDVVRNALSRIGGLGDVVVREPIGMALPRAYRNKMSLVVDHRFKPTVGFYRQRSHEVVPIEACPIVQPQLDDYIARFNLMRLHPETAPAVVSSRHIVARTARASGQSVVTFTTEKPSADVERVSATVFAQLPGAVGIANSFDLTSENAILGRKHRVLQGQAEIEERIGTVRYRVSAASFFQVNVEIVGKIFAFLEAVLTRPHPVVDLYCGAGTFSLFFASHGCTVHGIEENPFAVAEAQANAALNDLTARATFHAGQVETLLGQPEARAALEAAHIVFLDPPRKGSDEATLRRIVEASVPNVWYLSCDPATLARDLKYLVANGYDIDVVQPFDMFPQTGHVETFVGLVSRAEREKARVAQAFSGAPLPQWPTDDQFAKDYESPPEYPDFVIRND